MTEEQKRKMREGRERAKLARKKANSTRTPGAIAQPTAEEVAVYAKPEPDTTSQLAEAFRLALEASREKDENRDKVLVDAMAESHRRLVKPENDAASIPRVSAFNPRGDRDFPRPKLKCRKVLQCGFPFEEKAATYEELERMNMLIDVLVKCKREGKQLPEFMVSKADGSQARVTLETKWNEISGHLEELQVNYPVKTIDMRTGLYSFLLMLNEMLGLEQPKVDVPALQARLRAMETELATYRAMR